MAEILDIEPTDETHNGFVDIAPTVEISSDGCLAPVVVAPAESVPSTNPEFGLMAGVHIPRGGALHRFEYGVPVSAFLTRLSRGTCSIAHPDTPNAIVIYTMCFLHGHDSTCITNHLVCSHSDDIAPAAPSVENVATNNSPSKCSMQVHSSETVVMPLPASAHYSLHIGQVNSEYISIGSSVSLCGEVLLHLATKIPEGFEVLVGMAFQSTILFGLVLAHVFDKEQWPPPLLDCNTMYFSPRISFPCGQEGEKERPPWPPPIQWVMQTVGTHLRPIPWPSFGYCAVHCASYQLKKDKDFVLWILWKMPWLFSALVCWSSNALAAVTVITRAHMLFQFCPSRFEIVLQWSHILRVTVLKRISGWCEPAVTQVSYQTVGVQYFPFLVHHPNRIVAVHQLFLWHPGGDRCLFDEFKPTDVLKLVQSPSSDSRYMVSADTWVQHTVSAFLEQHRWICLDEAPSWTLIQCHECDVKLHLHWKYIALPVCGVCVSNSNSELSVTVVLLHMFRQFKSYMVNHHGVVPNAQIHARLLGKLKCGNNLLLSNYSGQSILLPTWLIWMNGPVVNHIRSVWYVSFINGCKSLDCLIHLDVRQLVLYMVKKSRGPYKQFLTQIHQFSTVRYSVSPSVPPLQHWKIHTQLVKLYCDIIGSYAAGTKKFSALNNLLYQHCNSTNRDNVAGQGLMVVLIRELLHVQSCLVDYHWSLLVFSVLLVDYELSQQWTDDSWCHMSGVLFHLSYFSSHWTKVQVTEMLYPVLVAEFLFSSKRLLLAASLVEIETKYVTGIRYLQAPWDPGGINISYRLGGKPILKKGGMLGSQYLWAGVLGLYPFWACVPCFRWVEPMYCLCLHIAEEGERGGINYHVSDINLLSK